MFSFLIALYEVSGLAIRPTHNFVVASESKQRCKAFAFDELCREYHSADPSAL